MPALTLLPHDRVGLPIKSTRVDLVDRFDDGQSLLDAASFLLDCD